VAERQLVPKLNLVTGEREVLLDSADSRKAMHNCVSHYCDTPLGVTRYCVSHICVIC
jgi:hypothetical protein